MFCDFTLALSRGVGDFGKCHRQNWQCNAKHHREGTANWECGAFGSDLLDKNQIIPRGGGVVTNDWCICDRLVHK